MHRPIFGHSFAVLVAPILLSVLAFKFLNKKKANARREAEDADANASGLTTAPTESESGGSSSSPTETSDGASVRNNYEVFLSFRGLDTRYSFTDHLYHGLRNAGIRTFRDDEELRQGEEIGPDLLAAIKNSQILIPILSVNYGESKWCLQELVQIMECKKNNTGHIVLPIFYKVAPADVRYQKGRFGKAFNKRESSERRRGSDSTILEKWKQALGEVGDLKGREANGYEAVLIKSVVEQVLLELKKKFELVIPENLVGIDSHVEMVMKFVAGNSRATLFVGIHGMGGIGKTTFAKTIYNKLVNHSNQFEHRSFIADVRESCKSKGIPQLQNQLILNILEQQNQVHNSDEGIKFLSSKLEGKKVLILLDDVDDYKQLEALAGNRKWFFSGSVIIITTRDESILDKANVDYKHELEELKKDDSLTLFSRHAFRGDTPPSEFKELADEVLHTTGGLPLSIEVLGSFLCGKRETIWRGTIKKLRKVPHEEVQKKLRISYEALTHEQKQIFLDIACFFIDLDMEIVSYMWDACDYFPEEGIEVLRFRSLIKVGDDGKLIMHDQLRDLGQEIVREENKMEPGKRSRLWDKEEVLKMLEENEGTEKIEAIDLHSNVLGGGQLEKLKNLRYLRASGADFRGDFANSTKKLKWLELSYCTSPPEVNNLYAKELVVLELRNSMISDKWQGWSFIMMAKKLKYLSLSYCDDLEKSSFLSAFENLEFLILKECKKLNQIDSSIGKMKSLSYLDLSECCELKGLPAEVGKLEALEILLLESSGIRQLPNNIGDLQNLEALHFGWTEIEELPNDIGRLRKLRELNAPHCENLVEIQGLSRLVTLEVISISMWCSIERLDLTKFEGLKILHADYCKSLVEIQGLNSLMALEEIDISGFHSIERLDLTKSEGLKELHAEYCENLVEIQGLNRFAALEEIKISMCRSIERLDLPKSKGLKLLNAKGCENLVEIRGLDRLMTLNISRCHSIQKLDLTKSECLKELYVGSCKNLFEIQGLHKLELLEVLDMSRCTSFGRLPDLCCFDTLRTLAINYGDNLHDIHSLGRFPFCTSLWIEDYKSFAKFVNLTNFCNLQTLILSHCHELRKISGLEKSTFLKHIAILGCSSIEILPDLSSCTNLVRLVAQDCEKLTELQGLEKLEQLVELDISGCKSLQKIPELSRTRIYQNYELKPRGSDDAIETLTYFSLSKKLRRKHKAS